MLTTNHFVDFEVENDHTYQVTQLARQEGATGVWSIAKAASAHLAHEISSDLFGKLSGGNRFGTMGGRMAQHLAQQRQSAGAGALDGNTMSAALCPPSSTTSQMPGAEQHPPAATDSTYLSGVRPAVDPLRYDGADAAE